MSMSACATVLDGAFLAQANPHVHRFAITEDSQLQRSPVCLVDYRLSLRVQSPGCGKDVGPPMNADKTKTQVIGFESAFIGVYRRPDMFWF
jgi:hypothetical protein